MAAPLVNKLTGQGQGFYAALTRAARRFGEAPPEVQEGSLLSYILAAYMSDAAVVADVSSHVLRITDICGDHHDEALDLLRLGLGAVSSAEEIWLATPLVDVAYEGDRLQVNRLLTAMLKGLETALVKTRPRGNEVDLTRRMDDYVVEIEGLLAKLAGTTTE